MVERIIIRNEPNFVKYTLKKYANGDANIEIDRISSKDEIHLPKECAKILKKNL